MKLKSSLTTQVFKCYSYQISDECCLWIRQVLVRPSSVSGIETDEGGASTLTLSCITTSLKTIKNDVTYCHGKVDIVGLTLRKSWASRRSTKLNFKNIFTLNCFATSGSWDYLIPPTFFQTFFSLFTFSNFLLTVSTSQVRLGFFMHIINIIYK